jgi:hypothetical protein
MYGQPGPYGPYAGPTGAYAGPTGGYPGAYPGMDPYGNPFMPYAGPTGAQSMAIVPVGELLGCCRVWLHACCVCVVGCSKRKAGLVLFFDCFVVLAANACVASAGPLGMPVALVPYGMGPFGGQFLSYVCFFPNWKSRVCCLVGGSSSCSNTAACFILLASHRLATCCAACRVHGYEHGAGAIWHGAIWSPIVLSKLLY